jgi:hypothetical protein
MDRLKPRLVYECKKRPGFIVENPILICDDCVPYILVRLNDFKHGAARPEMERIGTGSNALDRLITSVVLPKLFDCRRFHANLGLYETRLIRYCGAETCGRV